MLNPEVVDLNHLPSRAARLEKHQSKARKWMAFRLFGQKLCCFVSHFYIFSLSSQHFLNPPPPPPHPNCQFLMITDNCYRRLLRAFPRSRSILRHYASFLQHVLNEHATAARYLNLAEQMDEEAAAEHTLHTRGEGGIYVVVVHGWASYTFFWLL